MKRPETEDSLENTFSCVPKVQGESRISQANGQSMRNLFLRHVYLCSPVLGLLFCCKLTKEGKTYVRKTFGLYLIRICI